MSKVIKGISNIQLFSYFLITFVPIFITLIIYRNFLFSTGAIFYGDILPFSTLPNFNTQVLMWYNGPNIPYISFFDYWLPLRILSFFYSPDISFKLYAIILAVLPSWTSFLAIYSLFKEFWDGSNDKIHIISVFFALFYFLSPTNLALFSEPTISWAIPYALLPIQMFFIFKYVKNGRIVNILIVDCTIPLSNLIPLWIIILPIVSFTTIIFSKKFFNLNYVRNFIRQLEILGSMMITSLFIIVPILLSYHYGASGIYSNFSIGHTHGSITFNSALSHSYNNIWMAILLAHPSMYLFHFYAADWTWLTLLLPVFAFSAIFLYHNDKFIQYSAIILLIGIFFSKGANPPFGYLYFLLLRYSFPGTNGLIFDITPFQIVETLGYGLILSRFLALLLLHVNPLDGRVSIRFYVYLKSIIYFFDRNAKIVIPCLIAVLLISVSSGSFIQANNSIHYYGPQEIPNSYSQTINYLNTHAKGDNVIWAPLSGSYPGIVSQSGVSWSAVPYEYQGNGFPAVLSNINYVNPTVLDFLNYTHTIGKLLALQNVKYIVIHNDTSISVQHLKFSLFNQTDLKLVKSFGNLTIWLNKENVSSYWVGKALKINREVSISNLLQIGFNPLNSILLNNYSGNNTDGFIDVTNNSTHDQFQGNYSNKDFILFADTTFNNVNSSLVQNLVKPKYHITSFSKQFHISNLTNGKDSLQVSVNYNIPKEYLNTTHNISPSGTYFELNLLSNVSNSQIYNVFPSSIIKDNLTEGTLFFNINISSINHPGAYHAIISVYNPGFNFTHKSSDLFYFNYPGAIKLNNTNHFGTHLLIDNSLIRSSLSIPKNIQGLSINVSLFAEGNISLEFEGTNYSFDFGETPSLITFKTRLPTNLQVMPILIKSKGTSKVYSVAFSDFGFNQSKLVPINTTSNSHQVKLKFLNLPTERFITTSITYSNGWTSNAKLEEGFFTESISIGPISNVTTLSYLPQTYAFIGIDISMFYNASLIFISILLAYKKRY